MILFARRVQLVSDRGIQRIVPSTEAERIFQRGKAFAVAGDRRLHVNRDSEELNGKKKIRCKELHLPNFHPQPTDRHAGSSLIPGFMQSLQGGQEILIETATETRVVMTRPCRVYKIKAIPESLAPIYRTVLLENLCVAAH